MGGMLRTEVAFLRAVNVAGHASLRMTDLRRVFEVAGCKNARTYIQSGNVLFQSTRAASAALRRRIETGLAELVGQPVAIAYRTLEELRHVFAAAPFHSLEGDPDVKLYVSFLVVAPKKLPALPIESRKESLEVVGITKREVFVVSRRFKGRFGFPNNFVEKELAATATSRNWNTVRKIVAMAEGPGGGDGDASPIPHAPRRSPR